MKHASLLLLAAALLTSCGSPKHIGSTAPAYAPATANAPSRIIRKDGSMVMKSKSLEDSVTKCVALVEAHHGTLQNANLTEDDYRATIRVPSRSLEPLMESLADVGHVTSRCVSADDVTGEYHDLEAELNNKRALRDRLRLLLSKSTTIKDTLAIEKELARAQSELDLLEGRMKLLRSQVTRATLDLNLDRERIPGPLGAVTKGTGWALRKLFVLN